MNDPQHDEGQAAECAAAQAEAEAKEQVLDQLQQKAEEALEDLVRASNDGEAPMTLKEFKELPPEDRLGVAIHAFFRERGMPDGFAVESAKLLVQVAMDASTPDVVAAYVVAESMKRMTDALEESMMKYAAEEAAVEAREGVNIPTDAN